MTNPSQCETQITDLSVLIGKYSFDSQHGGLDGISWSFTVLTTTQTITHLRGANGKNWPEQTRKNVIPCYFKSNPIQWEYTKIIIEIWVNSAWFNTSQARKILKKQKKHVNK